MPINDNELSLLVIVSAKRGDDVQEKARFRGEPETFYYELDMWLKFSSIGDPDEIVIRILRPVQE